MNTGTTDHEGYVKAHETAVFFEQRSFGLARLTGQTRLDLLHRMSTQDLRGLQAGEGRATVLTTEIGRIIDRLIVFAGEEDTIILTGQDNVDAIARYLLRFVFFNDDFQITPLTDKAIMGVYGANATAILETAGLLTGQLPLYGWQHQLYRVDPVAGDGYIILCPPAELPLLSEKLAAAGASLIDNTLFEYLRIESGQPRFGRELTNAYIPLETGLWDDVSFSKGCYIGQEIIARMESRGKLAKQLVKLIGDDSLIVGSELSVHGKKVGVVTSAQSGAAGHLALGYVKTAVLESEETVVTADNVTVTIV